MNKSINDDCENRKKQLNKIMEKIRLQSRIWQRHRITKENKTGNEK